MLPGYPLKQNFQIDIAQGLRLVLLEVVVVGQNAEELLRSVCAMHLGVHTSPLAVIQDLEACHCSSSPILQTSSGGSEK